MSCRFCSFSEFSTCRRGSAAVRHCHNARCHREIAQTTQVPATSRWPQGNRSVISSQLEGTVYSHTLSPGREVRAGDLLIEIASPEFHKLQLDLLTTSLDASLARHRADRLESAKGMRFGSHCLERRVHRPSSLRFVPKSQTPARQRSGYSTRK